jgi:hemerythrin
MEHVGYPDRLAHCVRHKEIIASMNGILLNCSNLVELGQRLRHLMLDWVLKHVVEYDSLITASVDHVALAAKGEGVGNIP